MKWHHMSTIPVLTSLCAQCGGGLYDRSELCKWHHDHDVLWSAENRRMCDFVHRGVPLPWITEPIPVEPEEPTVVMATETAWYEG